MGASIQYNIAKLKAGDRGEYEKIFYEFYDVLFSLAKQYLLNEADAEEIVQDAYMKLWEVRLTNNRTSKIFYIPWWRIIAWIKSETNKMRHD